MRKIQIDTSRNQDVTFDDFRVIVTNGRLTISVNGVVELKGGNLLEGVAYLQRKKGFFVFFRENTLFVADKVQKTSNIVRVEEC